MIRNLHELCNIQYGYAFDSASFTDDASYTPLVRIRDVKRGYSETYYSGAYSDEYIIRAGDLLVGMDGEFNAAKWKSRDALLNQRVCKIIAKKETDGEYLRFALSVALKIIEERTAFVTVKHLSVKELNKIKIQAPSYEEQKNIAGILLRIEEIIQAKQDELRKLDSLIKARFVEMFGTSGANPKGWNEIKLGEVCSLQNGYAFKSSDYINKSSVLNCRMSNIRPDGGFDAEYHPKYLPDEYWDKCSGYRLFDGDVIIAMTDMASDPKILGVPTIVSTNGKKFLLNQRVGKLSFLHDDRMNRVYLMHSLGQKYIRKELAKSAAGSTQINVGKPAILNINIYDPPRSLQDQFATFVVQVDKSKFAVQKSLEKTQLLFDSLMQEYFG